MQTTTKYKNVYKERKRTGSRGFFYRYKFELDGTRYDGTDKTVRGAARLLDLVFIRLGLYDRLQIFKKVSERIIS